MTTTVTTESIARVVHEANRAYCLALGDSSQVPWDEAPEWQRQSARNGVIATANGTALTPEQNHESWLAEKQLTGWVYGEKKDAEAKTHPCMVPYDQLPPEQQAKDILFRAIVMALTGGFVSARTASPEVPATVETPRQRGLYAMANDIRAAIKATAELVNGLRRDAATLVHTESLSSEVPANVTLAYRHLEDASMRLGKTLQALDGGVSVYDKTTTVGA